MIGEFASATRWKLLAGLALAGTLQVPLYAIEPANLTGDLAGRVLDATGIPQMGATVLLYNRFDRFLGKVITSDSGAFAFEALVPDVYSIRVTLASFVPAVRRNISVQAGLRSMLSVNLASMLSSIELVYLSPSHRAVMNDEWKWVLRGSSSTRPILRFLPGVDISDPNRPKAHIEAGMFSETRGLVKVSSGESGGLAAAGTMADLGTAFAVATSLFGVNHVQLAGNFGYASSSGIPTAGFRTSFSRDTDGTGHAPSVNVTMRQLFLPARVGAGLSVRSDAVPALQTMSATMVDRREIGDEILLEYGSTIESVSFLNRVNLVSPFARAQVGSLENAGVIQFAYSSGAPPVELLAPASGQSNDLQQDLTALALFPRVTLRDGRAQIQRNRTLEAGYRRSFGKRTVGLSIYQEAVANAAFTAAAPAGYLPSSELLPDLASNSAFFNAGSYNRMGYTASASQDVTEYLSATVSYSYSGALEVSPLESLTGDGNQLRRSIGKTWRHALAARLNGTAPVTGTRFAASYQLTDYSAIVPVHLSLTHLPTMEPGLNIYLRQPVPSGGLLPMRLEASAELRNLLAEGYVTAGRSGGQRMMLIPSPRAVRGGLSFIF